MSNTIIIWTKVEDNTISITQILADAIDVEAHTQQLIADNPNLVYRFTTTTEECPIGYDFFFNALTVDANNQLAYDMTKARELWKEALRRARIPLLEKLDVDYQRADEINDATLKAQIVLNKNILRNCPTDPAIDAAQDLNDLRRSLPEMLAD